MEKSNEIRELKHHNQDYQAELQRLNAIIGEAQFESKSKYDLLSKENENGRIFRAQLQSRIDDLLLEVTMLFTRKHT